MVVANGPQIVQSNNGEFYINHPLHPSNPHYRSIVGEEQSANGYPLSCWRWMYLNREWRDVLRRKLWTSCTFVGDNA